MKKLFVVLVVVLSLISCDSDWKYEIYTPQYKDNIYTIDSCNIVIIRDNHKTTIYKLKDFGCDLYIGESGVRVTNFNCDYVNYAILLSGNKFKIGTCNSVTTAVEYYSNYIFIKQKFDNFIVMYQMYF